MLEFFTLIAGLVICGVIIVAQSKKAGATKVEKEVQDAIIKDLEAVIRSVEESDTRTTRERLRDGTF